MIRQSARFLLTYACVFALSLLMTACETPSGQPVAQSGTQAADITFQGETDQQESQTIEINNCDGKAEAIRTEKRAQTVSVTVSNELAGTLGVDAQVISAEVQAAVGVTKSDSHERSTEITLTAPPGTRMIFELVWLGKEQLGVAENVRGWAVPIAFKRFVPSDVRIIYQNDIDNCPTPPSDNPPAYYSPPTQEPIQNDAPVIQRAAPTGGLVSCGEFRQGEIRQVQSGSFVIGDIIIDNQIQYDNGTTEGTIAYLEKTSDVKAPWSAGCYLGSIDHLDEIVQQQYQSGCGSSCSSVRIVFVRSNGTQDVEFRSR